MVALLLQMILFIQFVLTYKSQSVYEHGIIFSPKNVNFTVDTGKFILYWCVILIMGGLVFFLVKNDKEKKKN